ncbi:MAG: hypothetical protein JNM75_14325 [Rhodospirillales bacterium]|nr:hypothetical protein [Rhodospirillales bacterium]
MGDVVSRDEMESRHMKVMLLLTGGGPVVILTSAESPTAPVLLKELASKGIEKFIAYEIPVELARERYGTHFAVVARDVHETDQLRILDFNGQRAFSLFHFDDLGPPTRYEA